MGEHEEGAPDPPIRPHNRWEWCAMYTARFSYSPQSQGEPCHRTWHTSPIPNRTRDNHATSPALRAMSWHDCIPAFTPSTWH